MLRRVIVLLSLVLSLLPIKAQENPPDFIQAEVDTMSPYVGQPVLYTWQWFLATANAGSTENARIDMPDFGGFGQKTLPQEDIDSQLIEGRQYQVITQQIVLYPLQAGVITIAPVRITTPETPFQPASRLETQAVTLNILPLPASPPPGFKNAIGQYDISAELNVTSIPAGQPVTLTVTITGTGNTEGLLAPDLPLQDGWRIYPNPPRFVQDTPQVGRQIFSWTLIPIQTGSVTIPGVALVFFNPQSGQYESRTTAPLILDVQPGQFTPVPSVSPAPTVAQAAPVLQLMPPSSSNKALMPGFLFWLVWLIPPLVTGLVWLRFSGRNSTQQPRVSGSSRALQKAEVQLKSAAALPPGAAFERVSAVILNYLSAKSGKQISRDAVSSATGHLSQPLQKRLMQCLDQAEGGRYAPVTVNDAADLVKVTLNLLAQVDRQWRKL